MNVTKLACVSCGAPIQISSDDDCIQCPYCGVTLQVQHGDGSTSLKLAKKVTDAIQDVGKQTQAAIRQESQATSAEIKKLQAVTELNTLRMQLTSAQTEIRALEREKQSPQVKRQLQQLRNQEWNLTQKIQQIEKQLSPSGSPNQPAQATSTGAGKGNCGGCIAASVTWILIAACGVMAFNPLDNLISLTMQSEFMGFSCLTVLAAFGMSALVYLYIKNPQSGFLQSFKDFLISKVGEPAKKKPWMTIGAMGGLLFLCVLMYAIPSGILNSSPAYHATQTVEALTKTADPLEVKTDVKGEATVLANQPKKTKTEAPAIKPTATPLPVILNVPSLFGKTSAELDEMLGKGTNPLPLEVNEAPEMPKGGRSLDYAFKGLVFTVFFGQDGKVGGFMLTEGLDEKGYKINQAEEVLQLFGIIVKNPPNGETIGLVNWENEQGYLLRVLAFGEDQPVWSIQVWRVQ